MKMKTLKDLRKQKGLTVEELASRLGVAVSTYRKYECFARVPKIKTIHKLKDIYECDTNVMLDIIIYHQKIYDIRKRRFMN